MAGRVGVVLWVLVMGGLATAVWLDHLLRQAGRSDLGVLSAFAIAPTLACVSAATVGAVLASRRPRHPVGWLLLGFALSLMPGGVTAGYLAYGVLARPGALPATTTVARYYPAMSVAAVTLLGFILLLTPTGSLPSPHWRWWARATAAAPVALLLVVTVAPGSLDPRYQAGVGGPMDFRGLWPDLVRPQHEPVFCGQPGHRHHLAYQRRRRPCPWPGPPGPASTGPSPPAPLPASAQCRG